MLRDWKRQRQWQLGGAEKEPVIHEIYLENTKLRRAPGDLWPVLKPRVPSAYDLGEGESGVNRFGRQIRLPEMDGRLEARSLKDAVSRRRSKRDFDCSPLSAQELSALLFATCGKTGETTDPAGLRTAFYASPSAGNLRSAVPLLILQNVQGVENGLYSYDPEQHAIHLIQSLMGRADRLNIFADAQAAQDAGVIMLVVGRIGKLTHKYGPRGSRYAFIDAGHLVQNTYLAASALGLQCCAGCDFFDDEANRLVAADGLDEAVIYTAFIGT